MHEFMLPRTESGEVDFDLCAEWVGNGNLAISFPDFLRMIDVNARAEERERCAKLAAKLKDWEACEAILKEDKS